MAGEAPDLAAPVRAALIGAAAITTALPAYVGGYTVFTRAPVPGDAPYPMVLSATQFEGATADGVSDQRPVIIRDVVVYGKNDTAANFRVVDQIAHAVKALFHRKRGSLIVPGWTVVSVFASGPSPAPTDDEQTVGRRVELTVSLARRD